MEIFYPRHQKDARRIADDGLRGFCQITKKRSNRKRNAQKNGGFRHQQMQS